MNINVGDVIRGELGPGEIERIGVVTHINPERISKKRDIIYVKYTLKVRSEEGWFSKPFYIFELRGCRHLTQIESLLWKLENNL